MIFNANHSRTSWEVMFKKPPMPKPLPRVLHFSDPEKIRDLYRRFGADRLPEDVQAFEFALRQGHGIVVLHLGDEQFRVLKQDL